MSFKSVFNAVVLGTALIVGALVLYTKRPLVLAVNGMTGVVGFYLHLSVNLHAATTTLKDSFLYGAPTLAPLLFPNLTVLGSLGIMGVMRRVTDIKD